MFYAECDNTNIDEERERDLIIISVAQRSGKFLVLVFLLHTLQEEMQDKSKKSESRERQEFTE